MMYMKCSFMNTGLCVYFGNVLFFSLLSFMILVGIALAKPV